jgi:MFS family permease
MALVLERGGSSSFEIGAVTTISTAAVMMCGPFYPRAIARLGLRLAIILGILVSTACCCSCRCCRASGVGWCCAS